MEKDRYINSVNLNAGSRFPYLVLNVVDNQSTPRNPGFQVMHWHEDLQFIAVSDGRVAVQTLDETVETGRLGRLSWAWTGERETKQRGNTAADERAWCRNGNRSSDLTRLPRLKYTGVILSLILDFPFKGVYNPPFWICFCP